jgi:hypothetical protein
LSAYVKGQTFSEHLVIELIYCIHQWNTSDITVEYYNGSKDVEKTVTLHWREPLDFVQALVTDPTLMADSHFHPKQKFLVSGILENRMYDEPWTGDTWWQIAVRWSHFPLVPS